MGEEAAVERPSGRPLTLAVFGFFLGGVFLGYLTGGITALAGLVLATEGLVESHRATTSLVAVLGVASSLFGLVFLVIGPQVFLDPQEAGLVAHPLVDFVLWYVASVALAAIAFVAVRRTRR